MRRSFLAGLAVALLALPTAARADSWQAPCLDGTDGPTCDFFTGVVDRVTDGDTLVVRLDDRTERVRITGLQAMERGQCHADAATDRLLGLIAAAGGQVRVAAQDPNDHSGVRARRSVALLIDGQWVDVATTLIGEGLGLFLPNGREWAPNGRLSVLAQEVAARGAGLWATESCAPGPEAAVRVWVKANGAGDDALRPQGEWVAVQNLAPVPLDLSGWWLRDSSLHRFTFTPGSVVAPGQVVKVFVGDRGDGSLTFGLRKPIFENVDSSGRLRGDGAYLFDPHGDLRAWMQYPCRWQCTALRSVTLTPRPRAGALEIDNGLPTTVDLSDTRLDLGERSVELAPGLRLAPFDTVRVPLGAAMPAPCAEVTLETYDRRTLGTTTWPRLPARRRVPDCR